APAGRSGPRGPAGPGRRRGVGGNGWGDASGLPPESFGPPAALLCTTARRGVAGGEGSPARRSARDGRRAWRTPPAAAGAPRAHRPLAAAAPPATSRRAARPRQTASPPRAGALRLARRPHCPARRPASPLSTSASQGLLYPLPSAGGAAPPPASATPFPAG